MCGSFSSTEGISLKKPFLSCVLSAFSAPSVVPLSHTSPRFLFEIAVIFKMESDRAEPLVFRGSSGMGKVAWSVLKRACHPGTDVGWRRGSRGIFFFGLSSPDTKLIMPLQLVAEHCVPWLTRCSGPADPKGEITAKLPRNPKTLQSRRLTAVVCAHISLGNCCFALKTACFFELLPINSLYFRVPSQNLVLDF